MAASAGLGMGTFLHCLGTGTVRALNESVLLMLVASQTWLCRVQLVALEGS